MDFKTTKLKIIFIISCLFVLTGNSQNLEEHKWKNRVLIINTTDATASNFTNQLKEFKDSSNKLKGRKLVIYQIINSEYTVVNYLNGKRKRGKVSEELKHFFVKNNPFEVVLIGLDGTIKLRTNQILKKEDLFSIIDSMPMRRNEMKN